VLGKIRFGKTGLKVSRIAFGGIPVMRLSMSEGVGLVREVIAMGINFIDTAHMYGDSEEKIGNAIRGIRRDELVLATKSTALDKDTFLEQLDVSLKRLGTSYVDIFQLHSVSSEEAMKKAMGPGGAKEGLLQAISEGTVMHPGFSSHNLSIAKKMMETGEFQTVQVPFNFVDREAADEILPLARKMDLGFICMKPFGGGLLRHANLCIRYLMQFEGIVPDPGIERTEEMREIVGIAGDPRPLLKEEIAQMEEVRKEMGAVWCHRCDYCQPCPQGIPISLLLVAESIVRRMSRDMAIPFLGPAMSKAESCTECRECARRCPYGLDIPKLLRRYKTAWEGYEAKGDWVMEPEGAQTT
jgi:uncharacterized protein